MMAEPLRIIDTSILIRYLTSDIPPLAERARRLVESEVPLGITTVAIVETAFVLRGSPYEYRREDIVDALSGLLLRKNIQGVGVDVRIAATALSLCRPSTSVSIPDALIAATGLSAGVTEAYSLDARFGRSGLRVIPMPEIEASS